MSKKLSTFVGVTLGLLGLAAAWADLTPVASLAETRPFAAGAAAGALALLGFRCWQWGRSSTALAGIAVAALALGWVTWLLAFAYRSEEIVFEGDGARLVGTVYLPRSTGPHPAAVFLHGSGASARGEFRFHAKLLARHGVAGFVYDKRGSGESTGDLAVPYAVYAADAVAAVEALAGHPDVDPARIGYFGHSEGAWVAPLAAERSGCAFVIATAATHLSPADQVLYESLEEVRRAGFDEEIVERVEDLQRELLEYQRSSVAPGGLDQRLAAALAEPWAGAAELPSELWSPEDYTWWRSVMDFDPLPHWRAIECPVLLVSGGRDARSDVAESQRRIAAAIERVGGAEATAVVFPDADHTVLEWPLGEGTPPPRWPDGYRAAVVCWLREVTALEPMPPCLAAFDAPRSVAVDLVPEPPAGASRTDRP